MVSQGKRKTIIPEHQSSLLADNVPDLRKAVGTIGQTHQKCLNIKRKTKVANTIQITETELKD